MPMEEVASVLAYELGAHVKRGRPVRRYGEVLRVEHAGHCAVWVGRDVGNDCIYFEGKGESTPDLVEAIRSRFPAHSVARADVCEDYEAEGAFERLRDIAWVGFAAAAILVAWGLFVRGNERAERLEPEAMERTKREDDKLED